MCSLNCSFRSYTYITLTSGEKLIYGCPSLSFFFSVCVWFVSTEKVDKVGVIEKLTTGDGTKSCRCLWRTRLYCNAHKSSIPSSTQSRQINTVINVYTICRLLCRIRHCDNSLTGVDWMLSGWRRIDRGTEWYHGLDRSVGRCGT